jgi:thiol:disulfide interchange protein DsbC
MAVAVNFHSEIYPGKGIELMERVVLIVTLLLLTMNNAYAMGKDGCGSDCTSCHSLTSQEASVLLKDIGTVNSVKMSKVRGLYEIGLEKEGKQAVAYMDYAKKYLIAGQVFELASRSMLPTPPAPKQIKVDPAKIPQGNALLLGNPKGSKKLYVFTDPDCPYCAKLHAELNKLVTMDNEVAVFIKLYPLDMHPKAYDKSRVILGEKSVKLLETAFAGGKIPPPGKKHPKKGIDANKEYAKSVGINSTPSIILPDGRVEVGSRSAEELRKLLSNDK